MKVDIYTIYRDVEHVNVIFPIMLDVLNVWSQAAGWETRVRACTESGVDLDTDADVVAFSVYTQNANSTYRCGQKLRAKGKVVIMGGPHLRGPNVTEATPYSDVAVHTINRDQWVELLQDVEKGRLHANMGVTRQVTDTRSEFSFPEDLYKAYSSHKFYQIPAIFATLGCPYDCNFCNAFQQRRYKTRATELVQKELSHVRSRTVALSDATFGLDRGHTLELFEAIAPLKKTLLIETTLRKLQDREMLKVMSAGGVRAVFVGVETLQSPLTKHGRVDVDLAESLKQVIRDAHDEGIMIVGSFIAGLDSDDRSSFEFIYNFYRESEMDLMFLDLLTPYPNTPLYYDFKAKGRLIESDWDKYDYRNVVYKPARMTVEQLIDGYSDLYQRITSYSFIKGKAKQVFGHDGLTGAALTVFGYHFFNRFDARRKAERLQATKELMSAETLAAMHQELLPEAAAS